MHLFVVPGLNKIARKLDIDCVPAMVGWEAHCGFSHPILDGFIVCTEFQDTLLDAWNRHQEEEEKKEREVSDVTPFLISGLSGGAMFCCCRLET